MWCGLKEDIAKNAHQSICSMHFIFPVNVHPLAYWQGSSAYTYIIWYAFRGEIKFNKKLVRRIKKLSISGGGNLLIL